MTSRGPVARTSVARGYLEGAPPGIGPDAVAAARTAAVFAVKDAARLLPTAVPFSLTDTFCDLVLDGARWEATVTVSGYARDTLETTALAGVGTALLAMWDAVKRTAPEAGVSMAITQMQLVQNVED